jgi:hypothetical protein
LQISVENRKESESITTRNYIFIENITMTEGHKLILERTSIILEIFAFCFVTVDLYGEERLKKLRDRINTYEIGDIRNKLRKRTFNLFKSKGLGYLFFFCVMSCIVFLADYIVIHNKLSFWQIFTLDKAPNGLLGWVEFVCILCAYGFFYWLIVVFSPYIVYLFFLMLAWTIKQIIKRYPMEGIMLSVGAVLFLTSKVIALYLS